MGDNLFQGLPPPSAPPPPRPSVEQQSSKITTAAAKESLPKLPIPALKSALKRSKPSESQPQVTVPEKRLRFKTTTDASETQVIEAMQKISSHIKNPAKFGKASKLAIQLIQAGSVKPGVSDYFFAILESAMLSPTVCNDASVRADCHALFSAAQDAVECFNKKQRNQLTTWMIRAVVANDLFTDDSFVLRHLGSGDLRSQPARQPQFDLHICSEPSFEFKPLFKSVRKPGDYHRDLISLLKWKSRSEELVNLTRLSSTPLDEGGTLFIGSGSHLVCNTWAFFKILVREFWAFFEVETHNLRSRLPFFAILGLSLRSLFESFRLSSRLKPIICGRLPFSKVKNIL
ncbi:hypothetical protein TEA_022518 [Camellia sinensis var. sinensis]|uniref:Uncharacterized protein n=1 Tax=Camellia sinensis var. sinensis TaxID=542762 RepID=A0A4V3WM30_CAMSN|nr:hypothetical protein TEA_022518 [Camellia sinensis var. sinensis]